jgi:hypothetical protein
MILKPTQEIYFYQRNILKIKITDAKYNKKMQNHLVNFSFNAILQVKNN